MLAVYYDALAPLARLEDATDAPFYPPSEQLITAIKEASQLRHARYCGLASTMGEIVVRRMGLPEDGTRRALFTIGRDLHTTIARSFGARLIEAGPRRLNPIMFPHTLPSATAVTLGAAAKAHLCAIGFDGLGAFGDALASAHMLLASKIATEVLLVVLSLSEVDDEDSMLCAVGLLLRRPGGEKTAHLCFEMNDKTDDSEDLAPSPMQRLAAIVAGKAQETRIGACRAFCPAEASSRNNLSSSDQDDLRLLSGVGEVGFRP